MLRPALDPTSEFPPKQLLRTLLCAVAATSLLATSAAIAQGAASGKILTAAQAEVGPHWQELTPAQRAVLKPLERDWSGIDEAGKQKWTEIATRYPKLPPAEQARISARMTQWSKLSPAARGQARMNYQEARQLTPADRQARWEAYQALSPEQRSKFTARAAPATAPARNGENSRKAAASLETMQTKSNLVPNPSFAAPPKPVGPTVKQAQPGATTSLISRRPAPPSHQQPGLPKIAASPGFVDKATLLPQRGPQGAAARPAASPGSAARR